MISRFTINLKASKGLWLGLSSLVLCFGLLMLADPALAQDSTDITDALKDIVTDPESDAPAFNARILQLFFLVTVLSLAPAIAMMITCLPFMVIVFSFLRQAMGLQQSPPNMMIMGLALFLTFFVMEPVFKASWNEGLSPYMEGQISEDMAIEKTLEPFRNFMETRIEPGTVERLAATMPEREFITDGDVSFSLLVTSFMLSEIKHAFQIGFVIFLPFLMIDLIVASILMAMGMMMVPPAVVSLPFKLAFFVMADGWLKITEALLRGYGVA